jgi:peptide/nickel transport system permease protein
VTRFIVRRLLQAILVLFAVSVLAFLLVYLTGDPVRALVPLNASQAAVDSIRHEMGLDQPLWKQYLLFVQHASTGDLGDSFKFRQPAMPLVFAHLPATAVLAIASLGMSVAVALPLGLLAAARRGTFWDHLATVLSTLAISTPNFWLGILLILLFAGALRWLPASGADGFRSLILPTIALSMYSLGLLTRLVRVSMVDILETQYMTTARSKGLGERLVLTRHGLPNALVPIVTIVGLQFGTLLGGSVIVETVFAWPGVGWLLIQAIDARDLPLVRTDVMIIAVLFVLINLATDVLYSYIDPRIRYA